ncbi:MAG: peptidoglycan editing factor PgeF [Polyangiales bacterium]
MSCSVLQAPLLVEAGFTHAFSTRLGGVSEGPFTSLNLAHGVGDAPERVAQNRAHFAAQLGFALTCLHQVSQVHGAGVHLVETQTTPAQSAKVHADALLCGAAREAWLAVRTADCVPVLLACPKTRAVAAVHAGWRGVVAGVLLQALQALRRHCGCVPAHVLAAIGPHIGVQHFEVGLDVAQQIAAATPNAAAVRRPLLRPAATADRVRVDLAVATTAQLCAAGLAPRHIAQVPGCTFAERDSFFSYRRDGGQAGRHWAVIRSVRAHAGVRS